MITFELHVASFTRGWNFSQNLFYKYFFFSLFSSLAIVHDDLLRYIYRNELFTIIY